MHIAFNRIDNNGNTISDRHERLRSTRICKELTKKYDLYMANGKDNVKCNRLKEPDRTKYELYDTLKTEVGRCLHQERLSLQRLILQRCRCGSPSGNFIANHIIIGHPGLYAKGKNQSKGIKIAIFGSLKRKNIRNFAHGNNRQMLCYE